MIDWPTEEQVLEALTRAKQLGTDGWRTMAEIAGILECPRWDRIDLPASKLVKRGLVEERCIKIWQDDYGDSQEDGPRQFRYFGEFDEHGRPIWTGTRSTDDDWVPDTHNVIRDGDIIARAAGHPQPIHRRGQIHDD